jgi:Tfp pilus assembly protein PilV
MSARRLSGSEGGVAFLEVLVAAGLFSIVMLVLPSMLLSVTRTNFQARDMTAAMSLAQSKLEELRAQSYAALAAGSDTTAIGSRGSSTESITPYTRRWAVVTGPVTGTKEIEIKIEWKHQGVRTIELRTMVWE